MEGSHIRDDGGQPPPDRPDEWLPPTQDPGARRDPDRSREARPDRRPFVDRQQEWSAAAPPPGARLRRPGPLAVIVTAVAASGLVVVVIIVVVAMLAQLFRAADRSGTHRTGATSTPRRTASSVPQQPARVEWKVDPATLRPGLGDARFIGGLDGDFSGPYVAEQGGVWLALTGAKDERHTELHAIDPDTGRVRWQHPLEGGLCASEVGPDGIVCASIVERDKKSGDGRRWRLQTFDPQTGAVGRSVTVNGWFTALHRSGDTVVAVEQRQPAPHAVLRGFDATTLQRRWSRDLQHETGHDEMFSADKVVNREPPNQERVLDRPRLRDVGPPAAHTTAGGVDDATRLVALWAGMRTAFVEPHSGRLVMMPHCSRLVDDGKRLWCNEVSGVASYSYQGKLLHRIKGPRLAFPDVDGVGRDRGRPVFINETGAPVSVDRKSGTVGRVYGPPGAGSALGMKTMPGVVSAGGHTFLIGEGGTMLIDPKRDKVTWRNRDVTVSDLPILRGDEMLFGSGVRLKALDLKTGRQQATVKGGEGLYTVAVGDRIAGVGPDVICLQQL